MSEYHDFTIACVLCGIQMGVATMTEEESEQLMGVVYTCRKCEEEFQAGIKAIDTKLGGGE